MDRDLVQVSKLSHYQIEGTIDRVSEAGLVTTTRAAPAIVTDIKDKAITNNSHSNTLTTMLGSAFFSRTGRAHDSVRRHHLHHPFATKPHRLNAAEWMKVTPTYHSSLFAKR
jgi:hypothetical protein